MTNKNKHTGVKLVQQKQFSNLLEVGDYINSNVAKIFHDTLKNNEYVKRVVGPQRFILHKHKNDIDYYKKFTQGKINFYKCELQLQGLNVSMVTDYKKTFHYRLDTSLEKQYFYFNKTRMNTMDLQSLNDFILWVADRFVGMCVTFNCKIH